MEIKQQWRNNNREKWSQVSLDSDWADAWPSSTMGNAERLV